MPTEPLTGPRDEQADFEAFVRWRSRDLLRTAYLLTGSHVDAEDLLQQAFLKVVPHWSRITGSQEAYVRTVLVREHVTRWRRRRWREVLTERLPDPGTDQSTGDLDLRAALRLLPAGQRAVIVLRYFEDLTEAETALELGISRGTVKSQHAAGVRRLRSLLPDGEPALRS